MAESYQMFVMRNEIRRTLKNNKMSEYRSIHEEIELMIVRQLGLTSCSNGTECLTADIITKVLEHYKQSELKEDDWAAYNWLDDEGNDDWKVGRILDVDGELMYFNYDGTKRCGYMPLTGGGVIKLVNK